MSESIKTINGQVPYIHDTTFLLSPHPGCIHYVLDPCDSQQRVYPSALQVGGSATPSRCGTGSPPKVDKSIPKVNHECKLVK